MKQNIHIPEQDLQRVIDENAPVANQAEIETHISDCEICQNRLLALAADPSWRSQFIENMSDNLLHTDLDRSDHTLDELGKTKNKGDEYDLETVSRMLEEIMLPPTHPEMLGCLGRNEIESIIGCGGMGVVLRGYDRDLQRPVAVKMILPRLSKNGTAKQRFAREARAAAAVLHPNVIAIHGIEETDGIPWFVMPLVMGSSLGELVREQGPLPEKEIVRIGMQIASGLAAAHSQGLVHRDIKPENILVDNRVNRVVITDFGLARRESEEPMTQTGYLAGTLNYMSPEQTRGLDIDARSDLFSLGSLLYFLAAGVVPFQSESPMGVLHLISQEQHADVRTHNPDVSKTLANVIDRLLEKDPDDRFQSAVDLETFLAEYIAHLHHPTQKSAPVVPTRRSKNRTFAITTFVLAGLVLAVCIPLFWNWWSGGQTGPVPLETQWTDIKQQYQLSDPDAFQSEFSQLRSQISTLDQMETQQMPESRSLSTQIDELQREFNRFEKYLD